MVIKSVRSVRKGVRETTRWRWGSGLTLTFSNGSLLGWVIDDVCFRCAIVGCGTLLPSGSQGAWTQLRQTWWGYRAIMTTQEICFRARIYLAAFFKRGRLIKLSDAESDAKFRTFWPLWKWRGDGRDLYTSCWSFTYSRTSRIHLMSSARLLSTVYW